MKWLLLPPRELLEKVDDANLLWMCFFVSLTRELV